MSRRGAAMDAKAKMAASSSQGGGAGAGGKKRGGRRAGARAAAARAVGDTLLVAEEGCCFPCEILEVVDPAKGVWLVHYLGWDAIRDERVPGREGMQVLDNTPENQRLCVDLMTQIRRCQRKACQLPRVRPTPRPSPPRPALRHPTPIRLLSSALTGGALGAQGEITLVMNGRAVVGTVIETAIRQQERGHPVTTMHYITFGTASREPGWYDQNSLKVATRPGSSGRQAARSAKAHMLGRRRDTGLRHLLGAAAVPSGRAAAGGRGRGRSRGAPPASNFLLQSSCR